MNVDIEKIKKHTPEELNPIAIYETVIKTRRLFSDEYREEMKRKHPDWYKKSES